MQAPADWLAAPVMGPVSRDAKRYLEPGSRDTQKSLVSPEPGSGDASTHARGACTDSKGLIGSRLSGACLALKSQVPRSQAQCMQPHRDWLLVCMRVGYAGKLIGWPPGCTARLYFGAAMKESWHAASQAR